MSLEKIIRAKINHIIKQKNTNVVLSADLTDKVAILSLVQLVGPYIIGVKLHSDIIKDFDINFIEDIQNLSNKYNFLIIEDKKFCDIGNTVRQQSEYITQYADLITVHSIVGSSTLEGLKDNCIKNSCAILLIAEMSSKLSLIDNTYTEKTIKLAKQYKNIVVGFICQQKLAKGFYSFAPGVKLECDCIADDLGQHYNSPKYLIDNKGVDFLIVGLPV